MTTAVAYFRTSSATNVGGDSLPRQQAAVTAYASARNIDIVGEYYDAAISGADPIDTRPGFMDMLSYMAGNGARIILVENASRFARDLIVQETGFRMLQDQGIELIAVDDPDAFTSDTPTAVMVRQILGAVAQFEKASLVAKLAAARKRKRAAGGHADGRAPAPIEARDIAKSLHASGASLRDIASELAAQGFFAPSGKPYLAESVKRMLQR